VASLFVPPCTLHLPLTSTV